ncbi:hypothetical protein ACIQU7_24025 [Streptomyces albidoflavus]
MSTLPRPLAEKFAAIHDQVAVAETFAEDGATMTAADCLVAAVAIIRSILEPGPEAARTVVPLEKLVETVTGALHRRSPAEVAAVPSVAQAIGMHAPRIRALGEAAATAQEQYLAALVEWIGRDWTCRCFVNCAEDPRSACGLSGQPHVHPQDRRRPGITGACPMHPDAPGDQ